MTTLVLADLSHNSLSEATSRVVSAAQQLRAPIHVLVVGQGVSQAAHEAAKLEGVERVLVADQACYAHHLAEVVAPLLVELAAGYDTLMASATSIAKDIMPRVAACLDVMQLSEVTKVISSDTFERLIYAGNAVQTVQTLDAKKVMTIRTTVFAPMQARAAELAPAALETLSQQFDTQLSFFVSDLETKSDRPELTAAKVVVTGGRALQSAENFAAYMEPLAEILGAAIGASRAAVDAGYAPNDWQIGQTGKVVAPDLYIAVGVSGAAQHVAGMKDSKVIVAINKDETAPIFQMATYGLVADLFVALPELCQALADERNA